MPATKPEMVEYLEELFAPLGAVDAALLFGGWVLRSGGRAFAVILDGTLYFRVDAGLRERLAALGSRPFVYAKAGRTVTVGRFMSAPDADADDAGALLAWARRSLAAEFRPRRSGRIAGAGSRAHAAGGDR